MPKQSRSQAIGREGEKWFESQLPATWIPQRPTEDVGVDALVVICDDGALNGLEFRVQIKSSARWQVRDGTIAVPFRRDSLFDLMRGFTPALLVAYDSSSKRDYYVWLNQLVGRNLSLLSSTRRSVTLYVPTSRPISSAVWPQVAQEVRGLSTSIGRRVLLAGRSFPILHFVHTMSEVLRNLDSVIHWRELDPEKTEEQINFVRAFEVCCHRDAIRALRDLDAAQVAESRRLVGLAEFAAEWTKQCSEFVSSFDVMLQGSDTDRIPPVVVDDRRMAQGRIGFIRSILDVLAQVTRLGLGLAEEEADPMLSG